MAEVRTIAVIGAGPVGRAIAQLAARGGYRTILEEGQELYDYAGIRRDSPVLTNDYEVKLISFFGMHAGYCIEADTFVYWMD